MTCSSPSVKSVADKTENAKAQVRKLEQSLLDDDAKYEKYFKDEKEKSLSDAKIADARIINSNKDIKVEYSSEFSLDKIAAVIVDQLKTVAKGLSPKIPEPSMLDDAVNSYVDLVNSVAQSAKSSAKSSASLSFSMTRLSPGLFAFLYATSTTLKDVDTFGSEAICCTAIYYSFVESIDDLKNESKFDEAVIDTQNLKNMKILQAGLTEQLANKEIDIQTWSKLDKEYSKAIKQIKKRIKEHSFDQVTLLSEENMDVSYLSKEMLSIIKASLKTISDMGPDFKDIVEITQQRIESSYF